MAGLVSFDGRPCDLAAHPRVRADAAGDDKRPVVALPLEMCVREQLWLVVLEAGEHRDEQPDVHERPAAAGVPGMFVQAKAGHAQGSTTEWYLHAAKTTYPDAAELAEARLFTETER
jgi:hypothetical protein